MKNLLNRHERRKQRTRRRLMDGARRVIAERGYEDTGVLDITETADVSKGTFYLHFRDKEDLTHALILEGFDELRRRAEELSVGELTPDQVKAMIRIVFQYAGENRDLFRIMVGNQASAELNAMALNYYAAFVEEFLIRKGTAERLGLPPDLVAQFVAGAGVRLGNWWIEDDRGLSPDDMTDILYRLLVEGLGPALPGDRAAGASS